MEENEIDIVFDYEYECGGHRYSRSVQIPTSLFENDTLLVLVCAYMQSWGGYPGKDIDMYLHNKFPDVHTTDDMLGFYNVYRCHVDGLKGFSEVADGLLSMTYNEAEEWVKFKCREFNKNHKGNSRSSFSIFE